MNGGFGIFREVLDDRLTRGGPSAILPAATRWNINLNSDERHLLSISTGYGWSRTDAGGSSWSARLSLNIKPSPRLTISTGPEWNENATIAQYVRSVADDTAVETYGGRYVFGHLAQRQLSIPTRANVILSPRVSIQIYAQPLISVGDYDDFKELARPRTFDFLSYGSDIGELFYEADRDVYQCRSRRRRQRAVVHVRQPRLQPQVAAPERGVPMGAEARLGVLRGLDAPAAGRDESRQLLGRPRLVGALLGAGRRHLPG